MAMKATFASGAMHAGLFMAASSPAASRRVPATERWSCVNGCNPVGCVNGAAPGTTPVRRASIATLLAGVAFFGREGGRAKSAENQERARRPQPADTRIVKSHHQILHVQYNEPQHVSDTQFPRTIYKRPWRVPPRTAVASRGEDRGGTAQ
eukprot:scaffold124427_cov63-Phaeocystis_antarctica.AAC.1